MKYHCCDVKINFPSANVAASELIKQRKLESIEASLICVCRMPEATMRSHKKRNEKKSERINVFSLSTFLWFSRRLRVVRFKLMLCVWRESRRTHIIMMYTRMRRPVSLSTVRTMRSSCSLTFSYISDKFSLDYSDIQSKWSISCYWSIVMALENAWIVSRLILFSRFRTHFIECGAQLHCAIFLFIIM